MPICRSFISASQAQSRRKRAVSQAAPPVEKVSQHLIPLATLIGVSDEIREFKRVLPKVVEMGDAQLLVDDHLVESADQSTPLELRAEPSLAVLCLDNIGYKKTAELVFTGRAFTAQEMAQMGMVNSVVPREKLDEEVMEYASVIAKQALDTLMMQKYHFCNL